MIDHDTPSRGSRARVLGAGLALALLLGGTVACSSDSDSDSKKETSSAPVDGADPADTDSGSDGGSSSSDTGSPAGLPDGFPSDVPLPDASKVDVIKKETEALPGSWVLLLTIDPSLEASGDEIVDAYAEQLRGAGFEVDDSGPAAEATSDAWSINFHSSMDGTLTVGTMPN